jgi:hypothetical protein
MSLLYDDKNIREKWLKEYTEEIKSNQEKKELEVFKIKKPKKSHK